VIFLGWVTVEWDLREKRKTGTWLRGEFYASIVISLGGKIVSGSVVIMLEQCRYHLPHHVVVKNPER
jgi:hypothetical protein